MRQIVRSPSAPIELSTDRLWLRAYSAEMAVPFWKLLHDNRSRLHLDFPDRSSAVKKVEDAARRIRIFSYQRRTGDLYSLGIFKKDTGEYIGDITLRRLKRGKLYAEVGYYLAAQAESQGYATEALKAMLRYAFQVLTMKYVNLRCAAENNRSQKVAERCGFTFIKTIFLDAIKPEKLPRRLYCYRHTREQYNLAHV